MLCHLPKFESDRLLVGLDTSDDAAVYKLNEETALIQTLDFFTPIVDDPYMFGQIAAANALSDVYAMGGTPLIALNIVAFPNCLPIEVLGEILRGGADKVKEAGALLVGGHSIEDNEPKYGLSVTGTVHPDRVLANATAKPGDVLILTKPVGVGILNTCIKEELLEQGLVDEAIRVMATLNKVAGELMMEVGANSCTDITGFGLIGHALEMAEGSKVSIELESHVVPVMEGALENAEMGLVPAGAYKNRDYAGERVWIDTSITEAMVDVLYDPQTSGGLLISLEPDKAEILEGLYSSYLSTPFARVGRVTQRREKALYVLP
ncbi:selenophosphate synthase [Acidaminobacter hydrogenoformans DSM 2784]|uniref:Selenide, water dikinase n=1 Tax=Acidaminobacter hydrogenoformans DSM 2784 TaxID=1120920 RepID=A0A1G5RTL2_9FIRM|nr:selenophosphate synthase [Acidaminobacter hydrogenoformans DSM 2784]